MKVIVEFGKPQNALKDQRIPCGLSGSHICASAKHAARLAMQLFHVISERQIGFSEHDFTVSRKSPRFTVWTAGRDFWITVSVLDGVNRGPYAATKEANKGIFSTEAKE